MAVKFKSKEVSQLGLTRSRHHVLFCGGPDCCSQKLGANLWEHLKEEVRERNIPAQRTMVKCLRVCHSGPWLLVYPEGIWYGELTPEKINRILDEHVLGGQPIDEWISLVHPLPGH